MIPYFELPSLQLPILGSIHPYGVMVGSGAMAAFWTIFLKARRAGIPDPAINRALAWSVAAAIIGAHLVYLLTAGGGGRLSEIGVPALLRLWDGTSSLGGIGGALAGFCWATRRTPALRPSILSVLVQGAVVGWVFGRLGCALAHDHPGGFSDFILAVRFAEGPRHDLGLYEFLYAGLVQLPGIWLLNRRGTPPLVLVSWVVGLSGVFRFVLEFLRAEGGVRWAGLTPAQLMALAMISGAALLARRGGGFRAFCRST